MSEVAPNRSGYGSRRRLDPVGVVSLMVLRFGLAGCQRQPHYPTRDGTDAGFGSTRIAISSDDCPAVSFTVTPGTARIGETIRVVAWAADANALDSLAYSWTASAGFFASPTSAETIYTCPGRDHAGPQTLGLSVSDGRCTTTHTVGVFCYALADGGGPATTGGGGNDGAVPDAGANCASGRATTCEGEACNACTNEHCETLASSATTGITPTAGCDILLSDEQQARCEKLYACMRDSGCVHNSDPFVCWCGSLQPEQCTTGTDPGNGPCLQQVIEAAGTSDPAVIYERSTDSAFPLGAAVNLATCRSVSCSKLSSPPRSDCLL